MHLYKIVVAYDGTDYYGWQFQPDRVTVGGTIRRRFIEMVKHEPMLVGASRTDAGVHALGQVIRLGSPVYFAPEKLFAMLQQALPSDIAVRSCVVAPPDFHPQKNVLSKTYYYHVCDHKPLPFLSRYSFHYRYTFDVDKLKENLSVFVGTHDFRSFCTGSAVEDTVRTIDSIELDFIKRYAMYRITVQGPRFLQYMIRRIVGASLDVARDAGRDAADLAYVLAQKNPEQQLITAPAQGLVLRSIRYKDVV